MAAPALPLVRRPVRWRPTGLSALLRAQVRAELGAGLARLEWGDVEWLAVRAVDRAGLGLGLAPPEALLVGLGLRVAYSPFQSPAEGSYVPGEPSRGRWLGGTVTLHPNPDAPRLRGVTAFHEGAEAILARVAPGRFAHADVWRLTFALALPCSELGRLSRCGPLTATRLRTLVPHVPTWVMEMRLAMLAEALPEPE